MKPRKTTYLAHRWIGLLISLQLLAWSTGGFVFSILDLDNVHGDIDARMRNFIVLGDDSFQMLPVGVSDTISEQGWSSIGSVNLMDRGLGSYWEVRNTDGELLARLGIAGEVSRQVAAEEAKLIAVHDFIPDAPVRSVELIETDPPLEYREKPLPAYRVNFDHPSQVHIYVDASTGKITSRRNRSWRAFDFFWMLHTMDYKGRDNFNHLLLTVASLLAIATSGTGLTLWGWRSIPKLLRLQKRTQRDIPESP